MRVEPGHKLANLDHAAKLVRAAADQGAEMVVLPEACTLGWTDTSARTEADRIPDGVSFRRLCEIAEASRVFLCAGMIELEGAHIFNTAVLVDPAGRLLLRHRKINELELGHDFYGLGNQLQVVQTPFGWIGVHICADAFADGQVLSRALGYMGADVILSPSSWAVPIDHDQAKDPYGKLWLDSYGPVARDFRVWIAGVSNVGPIVTGPWAGRKCIGCSLVMNPKAEPVLRGPYGEEAILICDVIPEERPAQGDGWARFWRERRNMTRNG